MDVYIYILAGELIWLYIYIYRYRYIYIERERETDRQTDRQTETDRDVFIAPCNSRAHPADMFLLSTRLSLWSANDYKKMKTVAYIYLLCP